MKAHNWEFLNLYMVSGGDVLVTDKSGASVTSLCNKSVDGRAVTNRLDSLLSFILTTTGVLVQQC